MYNNRQEKQSQLGSRQAKEKTETKKSNVGVCCWSTPHNLIGLQASISASTGLGKFGVVPQLPTMNLASAQREQLTSPATLEEGLRKL